MDENTRISLLGKISQGLIGQKNGVTQKVAEAIDKKTASLIDSGNKTSTDKVTLSGLSETINTALDPEQIDEDQKTRQALIDSYKKLYQEGKLTPANSTLLAEKILGDDTGFNEEVSFLQSLFLNSDQ